MDRLKRDAAEDTFFAAIDGRDGADEIAELEHVADLVFDNGVPRCAVAAGSHTIYACGGIVKLINAGGSIYMVWPSRKFREPREDDICGASLADIRAWTEMIPDFLEAAAAAIKKQSAT